MFKHCLWQLIYQKLFSRYLKRSVFILIALSVVICRQASAQNLERIDKVDTLFPKSTPAKPIIETQKDSDKSVQSQKKAPSYLSEMISYKMQLFKDLSIAPDKDTFYLARGEQQDTIPNTEKGMPFLKIKLAQLAGPQIKTIDHKTIWTIKAVHNNLCQVDDPAIEFIEIYKNPERGTTAPWFFVLACGNAIQIQNPDGTPFSSGNIGFGSNPPTTASHRNYAVSKGDVYLHDFSTELCEEVAKEHPFANGWTMWSDNKYAMKKFPYPNWCYWTLGILDAIFDVWNLQRTEPAPGKVVSLGTNYIITPGTTNHMNWQKNSTIYDETINHDWPAGKANLSITINNNGNVKAEIIDSQFPESINKTLVSSINKLSKHPAVIFPTMFPSKLSNDERYLSLDKQRHYMGVPNLPDFTSVTLNCTVSNKAQKQ